MNKIQSNITKLISASSDKYIIQVINPEEIQSINIGTSVDTIYFEVKKKEEESQIKQFTLYHKDILDQLKAYDSNNQRSIFFDNAHFNHLFPLKESDDIRFGCSLYDKDFGFYIPKSQGKNNHTRIFYRRGFDSDFIEITNGLQKIVDKNAQEYISVINSNPILKIDMKI